jgi:hypothetical protein
LAKRGSFRICVVVEERKLFGVEGVEFKFGIVDCVFERYRVTLFVSISFERDFQEVGVDVESCVLHFFLYFKSTASVVKDYAYWELRSSRS